MDIRDKVLVVTGAASGIGAALVDCFLAEGAEHVVAVDLDSRIVEDQRARVDGRVCDVSDPAAIQELVDSTIAIRGRIDVFCSNAGILPGRGIDAPGEVWRRAYEVNVLAHAYAAQAVLPHMNARRSGWLVNTVSAAGLLTNPGDAVYTATKHAAVGLSEWLAITYGDSIGVSVICPMGVATPLLLDPLRSKAEHATAVAASGEIVAPQTVAKAVIDGLAAERFMILPHPEVAAYWAGKAAAPDRWIRSMRHRLAEQRGAGLEGTD